MAKYRRKPVIVDAVQFTQEMADGPLSGLPAGVNYTGHGDFYIETFDGEIELDVGDWIITEGSGERYLCDADVFAITYDAVELPNHPDAI